MIYCVVPAELADELYPKLAKYYEDDPNVKGIIDRRKSDPRAGEQRRRAGEREEEEEEIADVLPIDGRREQRDRRRSRIPGDFPRVDPEEGGGPDRPSDGFRTPDEAAWTHASILGLVPTAPHLRMPRGPSRPPATP